MTTANAFAFVLAPMPSTRSVRMRCPVELTGKYSVTPSTRPRTSACQGSTWLAAPSSAARSVLRAPTDELAQPLDHFAGRDVRHAERLRYGFVRDLPVDHVGRGAELRALFDRADRTELRELLDPRERRVGERERARARHGARHVGDAVVDDAVDDVGRLGVRSGSHGLDAAALVDR